MEMRSNGDSNEFSCSFPQCHKPQAASDSLGQRCCCRLSPQVMSQSGHLAVFWLWGTRESIGKISLSSWWMCLFQVLFKCTSSIGSALPSRHLFLSLLAVSERTEPWPEHSLNSNASCWPLPNLVFRGSASAALGSSWVAGHASQSQQLPLCF